MGYNAMQRDESEPTFRRNMSLLSSGLKSKSLKNPSMKFYLFHVFMLGLLFSPEDGAICSLET
jgi:hypothetical protein